MAGTSDRLENSPYVNNFWDTQQMEDLYQYAENEFSTQKCRQWTVPGGSSTTVKENEATLQKFIGTGVSIVSLIAENLLSHPFVVLRRQCQVHNNSSKYHLVPVTLVPVICHLHKHQGFTTLWKGLGSALVVRGMTLGIEDVISKVTPWPKEISWHSSLKSFFQHTFLKGLTMAIIMPFYAASLVETVQSDIASEKPGILDVFQEGVMRLLNWNGNMQGRMLPFWALILPTVTLGLARYFFSLLVKGGTFSILQMRHKHSQPAKSTLLKPAAQVNTMEDLELNASLVAIIASDIAFYPFETILHRLYLQGTRTIIDNLDTGKSVIPILTNYYGPVDCYESCLNNEGVLGFYKGFGALILQYTAHILVIRITRFILTETTMMLYRMQKPPAKTSPASLIHNTMPTQTYLLP